MTTVFREALLTDAGRVAEIFLSSRKEFLSFAPLAHSDQEIESWICETLIPASRVIVAERDGRLLGMMALREDEDFGWIEHLYLDPAEVNRGIGSEFIGRAKAELRHPIRLHTFQQNLDGRRFYERHGFCAIEFTEGETNEERCPDVLYEFGKARTEPEVFADKLIVRIATAEDAAAINETLVAAADWLVSSGLAMWNPASFSIDQTRDEVDSGLYYVAETEEHQLAGVVRFQLTDEEFWPDMSNDDSAFIHKLAVRREFAGQGVSRKLIEYAKALTIQKGRAYLRLDCAHDRKKLRDFYESEDFVWHSDRQVGEYKVARYQWKSHETRTSR